MAQQFQDVVPGEQYRYALTNFVSFVPFSNLGAGAESGA